MQDKLQMTIENQGWGWSVCSTPEAPRDTPYIATINTADDESFIGKASTPAKALAMAYEMASLAHQTTTAPDVLDWVMNATEVTKARPKKDWQLDCPMCGASASFIIDANNPASGFCLHERTTWFIQPGENAPKQIRLSDEQRWAFFWQYCKGLIEGNFEYVTESLKVAERDPELERFILAIHSEFDPLKVPDDEQRKIVTREITAFAQELQQQPLTKGF